MKQKIECLMAVILVVAAVMAGNLFPKMKTGESSSKDYKITETMSEQNNKNTIVIDAGHGGDDSGKVGINGLLEKDINLQITKELKVLLESQGIEVILTRKDDHGLYSSFSKNKKVEDMQERCLLIEKIQPAFTVSIHQNSYPEESIDGAQVFYYGQSKEGESLAEMIQTSMVERLDPENHRKIKANESYYLLKKTPTPTVIVECGFLSNRKEAELLSTDLYQKKVAWSIFMGIMQYINKV